MNPYLLPCPFCGRRKTLSIEFWTLPWYSYKRWTRPPGLHVHYMVRCQGCDIVGPWGFNAVIAVTFWNTRWNSIAYPRGSDE